MTGPHPEHFAHPEQALHPPPQLAADELAAAGAAAAADSSAATRQHPPPPPPPDLPVHNLAETQLICYVSIAALLFINNSFINLKLTDKSVSDFALWIPQPPSI